MTKSYSPKLGEQLGGRLSPGMLSPSFNEGTFPPTDRVDMSLLLRCQRPFCELALIYSLPVGSNRFKVCGKIGDFLTAEAAERHESCKLLKLSQIRGTPA